MPATPAASVSPRTSSAVAAPMVGWNERKRRRDADLAKRRAKADAKRARFLKADAEYQTRALDKLAAKIRANGGNAVAATLENVPLFVWKMCWLILGDLSGSAARHYLQQLRNPHAAAVILAAAFGGRASVGRVAPRHRWSSLRARRMVAFGLAQTALAKPSRKSGTRNALVLGFGRGTWAALLADPYDDRPTYEKTEMRTRKGVAKKVATTITRTPAQPALTTLFGTHRRGAKADSADVGYFVALREAGFVYRQQLSERYATAGEMYGPSGHACNRYWVIGRELASGATLADAARWSLTQCLSGAGLFADAIEALRRARPPDDG